VRLGHPEPGSYVSCHRGPFRFSDVSFSQTGLAAKEVMRLSEEEKEWTAPDFEVVDVGFEVTAYAGSSMTGSEG
jgi:coenzyme PQQ precursor peptide PqqA